MKNNMKFLFGIMTILMCFGNANAELKRYFCNEGCFCLDKDGMYTDDDSEHWKRSTMCQASATQTKPDASIWYPDAVVVINPGTYNGDGYTYYYDDFSEYWHSKIGFYGFMQGEFVYANPLGTPKGMFLCPSTHPQSESGAKKLTDCFKYDANGNKIYYKAPTNTKTGSNSGNSNIDIETVNALVNDLQAALSKAQSLQNALAIPTNTTSSTQTTAPIKINNDKIEEKVKNLNKIDATNKIDSVKQTMGKRAASGPFKSNILNTYAGAQ